MAEKENTYETAQDPDSTPYQAMSKWELSHTVENGGDLKAAEQLRNDAIAIAEGENINTKVNAFDKDKFPELSQAWETAHNNPKDKTQASIDMDFEKEFEQFMGGDSAKQAEQTNDQPETPPISEPVDNEANSKAGEELAVELDGEANEAKAKPISKELDNRFSITEKGTKTLYAYSNDPDKVAFTEKDDKLIANDNNPALIKSMMEVAESKGWESVTVTGEKEFKREAWLEAKARGLDVKGYEPNQQDERKLERLLEKQNSISQDGDNESKTTSGPGQESPEETNDPTESASEATEGDKGEKAQSMPPMSEEGRELREKELKTAFQTLEKEEAIEKYPELENVYKVEPAAGAFYRSKGGMKEQEEDFKSKATDRAIEEVAAGREIPEFDVDSYKSQTQESDRPAMDEALKEDFKNINNASDPIEAADKRNSYVDGGKPGTYTKDQAAEPEIDFD